MMDHQISDNFSNTINLEKSLKSGLSSKNGIFFFKNISCDSFQDWGYNPVDMVYITFRAFKIIDSVP